MSNTLIYIGTHAIKPGRLEDARIASKEMVDHIEANHPRMAHFEIDIDDDANEMTVVQVHPDEASLRLHLELGRERIRAAYDFLDRTTQIDIHGEPSEELVETITGMAMGAPVRFRSAVASFSRVG